MSKGGRKKDGLSFSKCSAAFSGMIQGKPKTTIKSGNITKRILCKISLFPSAKQMTTLNYATSLSLFIIIAYPLSNSFWFTNLKGYFLNLIFLCHRLFLRTSSLSFISFFPFFQIWLSSSLCIPCRSDNEDEHQYNVFLS